MHRVGSWLAVYGGLCLLGCASPNRQATIGSPTPDTVQVPSRVQIDLSQSTPKPARPQTLSVVSYNVHLLPSVALPFAGERSAAAYRAEKIAEQLAGYDLIALNEAFDATHRQKVIDQLQAETGNGYHVADGPGRSGSHLIGGGLLVLSKYPILETHTHTYQNSTRFLTHGFKSDGFAAKGALHVRVLVDLPSQLAVDCFVTHLDSQSASVRELQLKEFCQFVSHHQHSDNPAVLLGDFNITAEPLGGAETEYANLMTSIDQLRSVPFVDAAQRVAYGPAGSSNALADDGGRRIDYLFYSNSDRPFATQLTRVQARHLPLLDEQVPEGSLSDHLAVACEFRLVSKHAAVVPTSKWQLPR
ncbi:hypothetical protein DTL21_05455 [Bremerella cremea]|uniref:Endonuclease/exonuclease/phosphatase domain-containing protein n=1 Tax=Blastopirellula marina TaxID=124 RepID=A0A2S8FZF0_9BACT|nr:MULTISPECIES: sphingomyelin phosphodiesterase [Pirellulaceae]PQO37391.1 hypothetical protein C5Y83_05455 [Blastopirellula marina]RCS49778.1 hypothetical protein DTL21_05455 [Bremerella cremea]